MKHPKLEKYLCSFDDDKLSKILIENLINHMFYMSQNDIMTFIHEMNWKFRTDSFFPGGRLIVLEHHISEHGTAYIGHDFLQTEDMTYIDCLRELLTRVLQSYIYE